jgi:hypothetical protein
MDSSFAYRFQTTYDDPARVSFLMERRKSIPSVLARNSGQVYSTGSAGNDLAPGSPVLCRQDATWAGAFNGASQGNIPIAERDTVRELIINNPCPTAYQGDVSMRVTAGAIPVQVSLAYDSSTRRVIAPPAWLSPFGLGTVTLSDILLRPGFNVLQLSKSAEQSIAVDAAYAVTNLHEASGEFQTDPLQLGVRHAQSGDLLYASIDNPRPGSHVGYVDFFGPLQLPLDRHPVCTLKYTMSDVPATFDLVLELRDRGTGDRLSMWVPLKSKQDDDWDLYALVSDVEREHFENQRSYHVDDPLWTAEHQLRKPPRPDDYTLLGVRLATVWPVLESTELPHGAYVGIITGARLANADGNIGTNWDYPESSIVRTSQLSEKSFTLHGMKLLRVETTDGPESRVAAQLTAFTPNGYRLAASLHVGDYVELALQNDKNVRGAIVAESSDYVVIQDGDNPPERIARVSISTVTSQTITHSAKLAIPISAPIEPTTLSFNVRNDASLRVRIGLTYEGPDGSRETFPAVDHEATDASGADVEPDFTHPAVLPGTTVFDLAVPIDLSLTQNPLESATEYDLDLWSIERFRFGGSQHRLAGIEIEFTQPPDGGPANRQYSIAVGNLKVSRDRLFAGDGSASAVGPALLRLDGAPVSLSQARPIPDSSLYFTGQAELGVLRAGGHVINSVPLDEVKVRAATLSRGAPGHFYGGQVKRFDIETPSEFTGSLAGAGLLVVPHTYDVGWTLALWPARSTQPALTGFALIDWLRSWGHVVPSTDHVPVNTNIDGWYIAPGIDGEQRFTMLFVPEALNELGFALTLLAVLGFAVGRSLRWRR